MRRQYLTVGLLTLLPVWAGACAGKTDTGFFGDDARNVTGGLAGTDVNGDGVVDEPRDSSGDVGGFPGAGNSGSGLALVAGVGPETAGACSSDVVPDADAEPATVETICLFSEDDPVTPEATIEQVLETIDERQYVHVRLTLNPDFVDNTYGDNAIGWEGREGPGGKGPGGKPPRGPAGAEAGAPPPPPAGEELPPPDAPPPPDGEELPPPPDAPTPPEGEGPPPPPDAPPPPDGDAPTPPDVDAPPPPAGEGPGAGGPGGEGPGGAKAAHTFKDLLGSDHAEFQLLDADGNVSLHFKLDYVSASDSAPSGFGTLGVTGGEGKVLVGDASSILAAATSIDRNLNGCGLSSFTESSPATDESYTPNPDAEAWDYRVVYEVWVDAEAFGDAGFGTASVEFVHASPSKYQSDTANVTPGPCPPPAAAVPPLDDDGIVEFPEEEPPIIR